MTSDTLHFMRGVSKNLQQDLSMLSYVHIMNITISTYGWSSLAEGLACARSLETLRINLCELERDGLTKFADGMRTNQSVIAIDLSFNNIKDSCGDILARIIAD